MIVKQIRLSQQAKDQLSRLKAKTGIKNWNILCRWALCYSLAEKTLPTDIPIASDSNLEMSWYTFGGDYYEIYEALVKAWCISMGLETDVYKRQEYRGGYGAGKVDERDGKRDPDLGDGQKLPLNL